MHIDENLPVCSTFMGDHSVNKDVVYYLWQFGNKFQEWVISKEYYNSERIKATTEQLHEFTKWVNYQTPPSNPDTQGTKENK